MSDRNVKASRRQIRRAVGPNVADLVGAHHRAIEEMVAALEDTRQRTADVTALAGFIGEKHTELSSEVLNLRRSLTDRHHDADAEAERMAGQIAAARAHLRSLNAAIPSRNTFIGRLRWLFTGR